MGRGGARSKASGGTMSQESPLINQPLSLNMTLFQFLRTGYFEKDLLSYCANAIAEYSCIYWLDPTVENDSEGVELPTVAQNIDTVSFTTPSGSEFTKYPSHFISRKATDWTAGPTMMQRVEEGEPIHGTFLGPVNVRKVIMSEEGRSIAILESSRLPLDAVARVILPFLIIVACLANIFILKTSYKLCRRRFPLAVYFVYLSCIEQLDIFARGLDYVVEAYEGIRLYTAVQFLSRASCQLLPMVYSVMRHVHASIVIGLAIDTWRLARNPAHFLLAYSREWTLNVFILALTLACTLNSQFLWTFDLSQLETKILHERIVHNAYECGFSTTSPLSPVYLHQIWPIIDHLWGEMLPCFTCFFLGISAFLTIYVRSKRKMHINNHTPGKISSIPEATNQKTNSTRLYQIIRTFALVCIVNGAFLVPRLIYYVTKYGLFPGYPTSRAGALVYGYNVQPNHPKLEAFAKTIRRVARLRQYEARLEVVESILRFLGAISVTVRAYILIHGVKDIREEFSSHGRFCQMVCCNKPQKAGNSFGAATGAGDSKCNESLVNFQADKPVLLKPQPQSTYDHMENNNAQTAHKEHTVVRQTQSSRKRGDSSHSNDRVRIMPISSRSGTSTLTAKPERGISLDGVYALQLNQV